MTQTSIIRFCMHFYSKNFTKYRLILILIITSGTNLTGWAQRSSTIYSPDHQVRLGFQIKNGKATYSLAYKKNLILEDSPLGISFSGPSDPEPILEAGKSIISRGMESYELITGKAHLIRDSFASIRVPLIETTSPYHEYDVEFRLFNGGMAFRYLFPENHTDSSLVITEERSAFKFNSIPRILALLLPNYLTSHEGEYSDLILNQVPTDNLIDMPALFTLPGKTYVAITEAALTDYAGMYLQLKNGILTSRLSPLPGQDLVKVRASFPHKSPWRVILVSDRLGDLIESNIITSLNEPCRIGDLSWLRPGKTTFPWWNGNVVPDTLNAPGNNFVTNQYYIDFCARNGLEYHSVVEYGLHQWYVDDGVNFQPGPHADVTTPVPGLDMKEICDYAHSKGVDVRVWVHWAALYPKLDSAFAIFERWGLSGMMVDFMDRDDQEMVNIQTEILQKAAQHKLHIQFHGAYKPTGLQRTYPNEFTREGTLNYEVNKWDKRITPDHDLNIVFTRLLAGPTDYHLGGFRAVPDSLFRVQYTRPLMLGTRCHMLAMYVVLESALGMVCDYPSAYEGEPGFEWIREVPTTWDETKVVDAEIHQYVLIARRKGDDWFLGGINNHEGRELSLPANFLKGKTYELTLYHDADDAHVSPNHLKIEKRTIRQGEILKIKMAPGGGTAMRFKLLN